MTIEEEAKKHYSNVISGLELIREIVRDPNNRGPHTLYQQCRLLDRIDAIIEKVMPDSEDEK